MLTSWPAFFVIAYTVGFICAVLTVENHFGNYWRMQLNGYIDDPEITRMKILPTSGAILFLVWMGSWVTVVACKVIIAYRRHNQPSSSTHNA